MLPVLVEYYSNISSSSSKHGSAVTFQEVKAVVQHKRHLKGNNPGDLQQNTEEEHSNTQQRLDVASGDYLHSSKIYT